MSIIGQFLLGLIQGYFGRKSRKTLMMIKITRMMILIMIDDSFFVMTVAVGGVMVILMITITKIDVNRDLNINNDE